MSRAYGLGIIAAGSLLLGCDALPVQDPVAVAIQFQPASCQPGPPVQPGRPANPGPPSDVGCRPVAEVTVSPPDAVIDVGQQVQLEVEARDAGGFQVTGRVVEWMSAEPGIAAVDADGLVTGVAGGVATVSATVDGVTGSSTVTVNVFVPAQIAIVGITQNGIPANHDDLSGTVAVTASIQENSDVARRLELRLGSQLVAAQDFADSGLGGGGSITLEVDTSVVANGTQSLEARLFTQQSGLGSPATSTSLVVNIQN